MNYHCNDLFFLLGCATLYLKLTKILWLHLQLLQFSQCAQCLQTRLSNLKILKNCTFEVFNQEMITLQKAECMKTKLSHMIGTQLVKLHSLVGYNASERECVSQLFKCKVVSLQCRAYFSFVTTARGEQRKVKFQMGRWMHERKESKMKARHDLGGLGPEVPGPNIEKASWGFWQTY